MTGIEPQPRLHERRNRSRRDECQRNYITLRVAGSIPAGPAHRVRSSVGRAEEGFANNLSSQLCGRSRRMQTKLQHHERDDLWGSTPHLAGALWHERGSRCFVTLVAVISMTGECRQDYRVARPLRKESGGRVFKSPLAARRSGAETNVLSHLSPGMRGECKLDYRIEHPVSAGRSGVQVVPRIPDDAK